MIREDEVMLKVRRWDVGENVAGRRWMVKGDEEEAEEGRVLVAVIPVMNMAIWGVAYSDDPVIESDDISKASDVIILSTGTTLSIPPCIPT